MDSGCHRPKLVVIVGRDTQSFNAEEMRRAITAYPDLEVVTYDRLLRAAKKFRCSKRGFNRPSSTRSPFARPPRL